MNQWGEADCFPILVSFPLYMHKSSSTLPCNLMSELIKSGSGAFLSESGVQLRSAFLSGLRACLWLVQHLMSSNQDALISGKK